LRYGALGLGAVYGFLRDRSLAKTHHAHEEHHRIEQEATAKANELWGEHVAKEMNVITDPDNPNFDLEKVLDWASSSA
jgi:hypothetical protein